MSTLERFWRRRCRVRNNSKEGRERFPVTDKVIRMQLPRAKPEVYKLERARLLVRISNEDSSQHPAYRRNTE